MLTVDQAPGSPFEMGFSSYNDANTDDATHLLPSDSLPFSPISADPRHQYEQLNFPPSPQHVRRSPVPYDHPGSSSTIVGGPGLLSHARFHEPPGPEGFNTGTASSSEQMLGAGPSLSAAQEQSPTTQEASRTHEERKKERDKLRKSKERSINLEDYKKICKLLDILLKPQNTLANRSECLCVILVEDVECLFRVVLKAVEVLVEQRKGYEESQRLLKEAISEATLLKKRVAELELR